MKAKIVFELDAAPSADNEQVQTRDDGTRYWPVGSIIDDPRAYRLVQMGAAVPADDLCEDAANRTPEQMKKAQAHYEMFSKGIDPDDYDRYRNGEITGYDENGNDIPGPNYREDEDE